MKNIYKIVVDYFSVAMPVAETELVYDTPFHLLVAVILSAQCTDKRVNMVTPALFAAYPTAESMAQVSAEEVLPYINSVSYPNNKAKHLVGMAKMIVGEFGGIVPETSEELQRLPGVGRKTANVMQVVLWGGAVMPVDTHVFRVAHRLGLVPKTATTPLAVEKELTKNFPADVLPMAHHWLILHGRYICTARKAHCEECGLKAACPKRNICTS